jgi:biotin/methionine sulfoxide reductase
VVHEPYWTATARCADVVLPSTVALERVDVAASKSATQLLAMRQVLPPHEGAKDDYEILSGLARALGVEQEFTEGRTAGQWVRHLYEQSTASAEGTWDLPAFDDFWEAGYAALPVRESPSSLAAFRHDPVAQRLATPSGRIEIHSPTIEAFGYRDCPGHSDVARAGPVERPSPVAAPPGGQPASHPAAQPARHGGHQPRVQGGGA